ncbi:MAG: hypothetical protein A3G81_20170 [Betaproteobacteria bacterium RIFCSPLOWO2_12_FULL_65_14]|nr:MAG: hypothetical protein A3G81_20170 [Betaproteobacteria bacterium RIFCSPLOWO2_12_FULL_65_14]
MSSAYDVVVEDGFIRVIYRGRQDFETTNRSIADAARLAKQAGITSVLFDFTFADPRGYFAETVRHGEMARDLGMSFEFRLAFYSPTQFDAVDFMETVARNRGYAARAFGREGDAVKWLTARA